MSLNYWDNDIAALRLIETNQNNRTTFYSREQTEEYIESQKKRIPILIIRSNDDLKKLPNNITDVAIDLETTSLDPFTGQIVGIGICYSSKGDSVYIPFDGQCASGVFALALSWFNKILLDFRIRKIFQNAKFDLKYLKYRGFSINGIIDDTMLMHYIITPHLPNNLKQMAQSILGIYYDDYNTTVKGRDIWKVSVKELAHYCCMDGYSTFLLAEELVKRLEGKLLEVYHLERKVCLVLTEMELKGVLINRNDCSRVSTEIRLRQDEIEADIAFATDTNLNINSYSQVSKLLFEKLGLPIEGVPRTKTGFSTAEDVLEALQVSLETESEERRIIASINEYRKIGKLRSTYSEKVLHLLHGDSRLRGDFHQAVTLTGRLSCRNPNLQNFPKHFRYMFRPDKGHLLIAADYSQCEVRILAYFSQDKTLLEAFEEDLDVHAQVTRRLLGREDITPKERYVGKQLNLAMSYGMEAPKLALNLGITVAEANDLLNLYWARLDGVASFINNTHAKAISLGYTETLLGRRRYFQFTEEVTDKWKGVPYRNIPIKRIKSFLGQLDLKELREAGNAPIQGSNADITKLAMVACQENLKYYDCHLLLQIHDELVFTCRKEDLLDCADIIKNTMEGVYNIGIPLKVDVKFGLDWSNLHDL